MPEHDLDFHSDCYMLAVVRWTYVMDESVKKIEKFTYSHK